MVVMTEIPQDHKPVGFHLLTDQSWPSLGGDGKISEGRATDPAAGSAGDGGDEWGEFQETDEQNDAADNEDPTTPLKLNPKILHRCASTPDFGNYDEYSESSSSAAPETVGDELQEGDEVPATTAAPAAVDIPAPAAPKPMGCVWGAPSGKGSVCRIPSFADMVKATAKATAAEEARISSHRAEMEERLRKERQERRKARARHMKLVVTPIRRCSKSTGDLASLGRIREQPEHHDEEDLSGGGREVGGSGGGGFGGIEEHHEEEVLGDTDAMEFYHRKAKGIQNRVSGRMERPDEAKRKEISQYKREVQRQKQQEAQAAKGGGKKKVGDNGAEKAGKGGKGKGRKKK